MSSVSPWSNNKVIRLLMFLYTGLDFFGPLYIKRRNHADRIFLALHLFIARRVKPQQIVLDSAPQFKLTKSSLDVAWENAIRDSDVQLHIAKQRIKWSFIVQLSSWMGGFYERLI